MNKSSFFIIGQHAVMEALRNPKRKVLRVFLTEESKKNIHRKNPKKNLLDDVKVYFKTKKELDKYSTKENLLHQGYVAEIEQLEKPILKEFIKENNDITLVCLDGVTDPRNIGSLIRSAASFDIDGILIKERNFPSESKLMYKAASGAIEYINIFEVSNINSTLKNLKDKKFFHVGPPRDFDLFNDFKNIKTDNVDDSEYILCTGLFDKHNSDLNYYKKLFENNLKKKMICTNPDLIVDRGNTRELCAGSVALIFEKMGGEVVYFGKPYPEVYNLSINNSGKKILSIGDNLNTDIKGANLLNYDSLIISNGIHKNEIKEKGIENTSRSYEAICNYIQSELRW